MCMENIFKYYWLISNEVKHRYVNEYGNCFVVNEECEPEMSHIGDLHGKNPFKITLAVYQDTECSECMDNNCNLIGHIVIRKSRTCSTTFKYIFNPFHGNVDFRGTVKLTSKEQKKEHHWKSLLSMEDQRVNEFAAEVVYWVCPDCIQEKQLEIMKEC